MYSEIGKQHKTRGKHLKKQKKENAKRRRYNKQPSRRHSKDSPDVSITTILMNEVTV